MSTQQAKNGGVSVGAWQFPTAVRGSLVWRSGTAALCVCIAWVASTLLRPLIDPNPFLLFFGAVALSAWFGGLSGGLIATALSVPITNFFFIPPFYQISTSPVDIARLVGFIAIASLISSLFEARSRAVAIIQAQRDQLEVTLASIGDGVITTDATGRVAMINGMASALTGWQLEEARGQRVEQVFHIINEHTRQPVENPIARVLAEGIIVGLANHTLLIGRDGVERPIDDSGAPIRSEDGQIIGAVLVFRDISERAQQEAAREELLASVAASRDAAEQQAHLRLQLQLMTAALSVPLTAQEAAQQVVTQALAAMGGRSGGIALRVNNDTEFELAYVSGVSEEYVRAYARFPSSAPTITAEAVRRNALITIESPEELRAHYPNLAAIPNVAQDGAWVGVPIRVGERVVGGMGMSFAAPRAFSSDDREYLLTLAQQGGQALERARLYEAERAARAEAEAAVQMRDAFLSIASHELKTPLTALLMQAQLVERRMSRAGTLSASDRRSLEVITRQATRLNRMIGALLDISHIEQGQLAITRAPFDLRGLIVGLLDELQPASNGHSFSFTGAAGPVVIAGDELRLEQVLQNLLQNAIKYSPQGGLVEVRLEEGESEVRVSVSDQGIGIPADALPRLFTRFYRADNAESFQISGIGVGLYVVKEIIALHGGTVEVKSVVGEGSTFTITLPRSAAAAAP